jgi:DNA topoisomerase-6 subunit B
VAETRKSAEKKVAVAKEVRSTEIFREFREHSIAEFFKKNRQMLGYSGKIKSLTTAVHEYVTNSLDACEEGGILPNIWVTLERMGPDHYKLIVEDNGPGIPKKFVAKAMGSMLAGTKFHRFKQARGQQGIGASGVIMFSQISTGKPTKIVTSTGDGKLHETKISIDVKTNSAKLTDEIEYNDKMRGTRLESELKDVAYQKGDQSVDEYLRRTALVNPHAKITFIDPEKVTTVWDRAVKQIPERPKSSQPHPKGVGVDDLMSISTTTASRSVKSMLVSELARMSSAKANEIKEKVSFDIEKRPRDMTWAEAEEIVKAIKVMSFIAPPTDVLVPIGEKNMEKALDNILQPQFKTVLTRPAAVYRGGVPFVVEVGLAYGGKAGKEINNNREKIMEKQYSMEIMRFANRVPLLFDAGTCALNIAVQDIEWKRYGIQEAYPMAVLVNFTSVHVPYTGAGKQAVVDEEGIIKDVRLALMDAGRRLGLYVSGVRKKEEKEAKRKQLLRYVDPISEALAILTNKSDKNIAKSLRKLVEDRFEEIEDENGKEESDVRETEEAGSEDSD